jgi:hypothetical protein
LAGQVEGIFLATSDEAIETLCGVEKEIEIPEREHPFDEYTVAQLDEYQAGWEIVE